MRNTIEPRWTIKMPTATTADSVIPRIESTQKKNSRMMVPQFAMYDMHSVALTTAVATYDRIVSTAASEATDFDVVFSSRLYAPPLRGIAVPA
eukprot:1761686-Rhodomonas_salina.3